MAIYPLSTISNMHRKDSLNDGTPDLSSLKHEHCQEEGEQETTTEPKDGPIWKRKIWLACMTGDDEQVEKYLKDPDVSGPHLTHGRDRNDNTALVIASREISRQTRSFKTKIG